MSNNTENVLNWICISRTQLWFALSTNPVSVLSD